jgi:hypothetical protein
MPRLRYRKAPPGGVDAGKEELSQLGVVTLTQV